MSPDTICAPASGPLAAPIAVIRVSGPGAHGAVAAVFSRPDALLPRRAVFGSILDGETLVDDVVMVCYAAPASFTGEDSAEIFCHGNHLIVRRILSLLHARGVRLAEPGEFSRRAFENGKIDLTAAEAINHIITARSDWEIEAALAQAHGSLRDAVRRLREDLVAYRADIECAIDFAEEEVPQLSREESLERITSIAAGIDAIRRRCATGERLARGIDAPLIGRPNVGKSSILNCVLNAERALVSHIPGTTRDLIRETVQFAGVPVNLIDTAGIGAPGCELERMGIELSQRKIREAGIVIMVLDAVDGLTDDDRTILDMVADRPTVYLANKADLAATDDIAAIGRSLGRPVIPFSAVRATGLDALEAAIGRLVRDSIVEPERGFLADHRIMALLDEAIGTAQAVRTLVAEDRPPEIVAFELQTLADTLGTVTGEITPEDVLTSVFSRFCIGK